MDLARYVELLRLGLAELEHDDDLDAPLVDLLRHRLAALTAASTAIERHGRHGLRTSAA